MTPTGVAQGLDGEKGKDDEQRKEVAMLENMIQDAQAKYESTIRQHLQLMQSGSTDADSRKFPELYANVRKWQEQLEPVLKEFESRPEFDIDIYGTKLLAKLSSMDKTEEMDGLIVPFAHLVNGHKRWEICRRFLTTLMLTNQGNTDILYQTEEERLNKFKIQVLDAEKKRIALDVDDPAVATKVAPLTGRTKKRGNEAAPLPLQTDGGE